MRIKTFDGTCASTQHVTVVGNGPLTQQDRSDIANATCVVRFNDMKNYVDGDPAHIVALRSNTLQLSEKYEDKMTILPIVENEQQFATFASRQAGDTLLPLFVTEVKSKNTIVDQLLGIFGKTREKSSNTRISTFEDQMLFPHCKRRKCHSETTSGPSSGAIVLDHLQNMAAVKTIDVYGMNWNGGRHHVDFKHNTLLKHCCSKCNFHDTACKRYIP